MVHHEAYMRMIEGVARHGEMTVQDRMNRITEIINEYVVEMEEEHNKPFDNIKIKW